MPELAQFPRQAAQNVVFVQAGGTIYSLNNLLIVVNSGESQRAASQQMLSLATRHKCQPLKQMHILLVFQQGAVQAGQGAGATLFQVIGCQVFGQ